MPIDVLLETVNPEALQWHFQRFAKDMDGSRIENLKHFQLCAALNALVVTMGGKPVFKDIKKECLFSTVDTEEERLAKNPQARQAQIRQFAGRLFGPGGVTAPPKGSPIRK